MIVIALIICGLKFPFIGRRPELSTIPGDTWPRIREPGRWLHDMTILAVETVRADAQWWTKCLSFAVLLVALVSAFAIWEN